jgi:hypothetical protein
MSAPVGSLRELQDLLEGGHGGYRFEQRPFHFYSVLMYTPTNGLNKLLHEYVVSHDELFNAQTGPNWLVAILEDIHGKELKPEFRPQDVYKIARYLGVPVNAIPAIVFFTEPKGHKETLILRLRDIFPYSSKVTDEDLTELFSKIAATIDNDIDLASNRRLDELRKALISEWKNKITMGERITSVIGALTMSASTMSTVFNAIGSFLKLFPSIT